MTLQRHHIGSKIIDLIGIDGEVHHNGKIVLIAQPGFESRNGNFLHSTYQS